MKRHHTSFTSERIASGHTEPERAMEMLDVIEELGWFALKMAAFAIVLCIAVALTSWMQPFFEYIFGGVGGCFLGMSAWMAVGEHEQRRRLNRDAARMGWSDETE